MSGTRKSKKEDGYTASAATVLTSDSGTSNSMEGRLESISKDLHKATLLSKVTSAKLEELTDGVLKVSSNEAENTKHIESLIIEMERHKNYLFLGFMIVIIMVAQMLVEASRYSAGSVNELSDEVWELRKELRETEQQNVPVATTTLIKAP
jgi:hypothetical protein